MADKRIIGHDVDGATVVGASDFGTVGRVKLQPATGVECQRVETIDPATAIATIRNPGFGSWWANLWTGAASSAVRIFQDKVEVSVQAAGVPDQYEKRLEDGTANVFTRVARNVGTGTLYEIHDPDSGDQVDIYPNFTIGGLLGFWLNMAIDKAFAFRNAGWTSVSGRPAFLRRVFSQGIATDVLDEVQDNDADSMHRVEGLGTTEKRASCVYGGGLREGVEGISVADAAFHVAWNSLPLADGDQIVVTAEVLGTKSTGAKRGNWLMRGTFYRDGGNITQQGMTRYLDVDPMNDPNWDCVFTLDIVSQWANVKVKGEATTRFKIVARVVKCAKS